MSGPPKNVAFTKIADLRPGAKNLNCVFIVLEKGNATKTKEEHLVYQALVADQSGSMYPVIGEQIQTGDIIRLKGGYCTLYKNSLILYPGKKGSIERIGEFTMVFSETPNMSTMQWTADPNNPNNFILGNSSQAPNSNNQPQPLPPLLPPLLPK